MSTLPGPLTSEVSGCSVGAAVGIATAVMTFASVIVALFVGLPSWLDRVERQRGESNFPEAGRPSVQTVPPTTQNHPRVFSPATPERSSTSQNAETENTRPLGQRVASHNTGGEIQRQVADTEKGSGAEESEPTEMKDALSAKT